MELINSILQVFNNRELAIIFWGLIFTTWMILNWRQSLVGVIKSFFSKSILFSILIMLIYIAILVGLLYYFEIWDLVLLKDTIYWTLGVGFILFINVDNVTANENYFGKILIDNFKLIVVLQFLSNLYFFNLILEIIFAPLLLLLMLLSTYSENKDEYTLAKKLSNILIGIYGFAVLIFSGYHVISDFENLKNINSLKSFLLSPVLTLLYIPFLYFMALFMAYESFLKSNKWILKDNMKSYRFLKWQVLKKCNFSIKRLKKVTEKLHVYVSIKETEIINELDIILSVEKSKSVESVEEPKPEIEERKIEFPQYSSVIQMLNNAGDFKEKDGTLKILSKNKIKPHVQVSKWVFEGDSEKLIEEQTKRDVIYVVFQTFAKTDIEEITVTSVPLRMKNFKNRDKYLVENKLIKKVKREEARKILNKYLLTSEFKELYDLENEVIWLPNKKFSKLKFEDLNNVYDELK